MVPAEWGSVMEYRALPYRWWPYSNVCAREPRRGLMGERYSIISSRVWMQSRAYMVAKYTPLLDQEDNSGLPLGAV